MYDLSGWTVLGHKGKDSYVPVAKCIFTKDADDACHQARTIHNFVDIIMITPFEITWTAGDSPPS